MSTQSRTIAPESADALHPKAFEPATLVVLVLVSVVGAVIGLQIITTLGVTPNTSIIGVIAAIAIGRIPLAMLRRFRSVHRQNLVQTSISTATFVAANSLLLPIAVVWLLGKPGLVWPMLGGAAAGALIDFLMLYWMFDSHVFPGRSAWPPGLAAAEAIRAGDEGGRRAGLLGIGTIVGIGGSVLGIPMSAFGVAFIGNMVALTMFGLGLLLRGYSDPVLGIDIAKAYIPHGFMIGAGLVALVQAVLTVVRKRSGNDGDTSATAVVGTPTAAQVDTADTTTAASVGTSPAVTTRDERDVRRGLARGAVLYPVVGLILALLAGLMSDLGLPALLGWVVFASVSCIAAEFIVGLSAMHSGWFPSFATALIFLTLGILIGFPPVALALMVGFVSAGGPAFADAGYDFKAGWVLRRDRGRDSELAGRHQQLLAGLVGMVAALAVVALSYRVFFDNGQFPPVAKVFVATIQAGVDPSLFGTLALWAIPGAIVQLIGGSARQMGILFATGMLISNPLAGWAVVAGLILRVVYRRVRSDKEAADTEMTIAAAGFIAGDALWSFGNSVYKLGK